MPAAEDLGYDLDVSHTLLFLQGDLNYRIVPSSPERFNETLDMVSAAVCAGSPEKRAVAWRRAVCAREELRALQSSGGGLFGFKEGVVSPQFPNGAGPTFPPTFKRKLSSGADFGDASKAIDAFQAYPPESAERVGTSTAGIGTTGAAAVGVTRKTSSKSSGVQGKQAKFRHPSYTDRILYKSPSSGLGDSGSFLMEVLTYVYMLCKWHGWAVHAQDGTFILT